MARQHLRSTRLELPAVSIKMWSASINMHRFDTQMTDWIHGPTRPCAVNIDLFNASSRL